MNTNSQTEIKHLTVEELEDFLKTVYDAGNTRDFALFTTIYHWALRAAEATDLRLDDLCLDRTRDTFVARRAASQRR